MTNEEKLKELIIRENKLEEQIEVTKCPFACHKLLSELAALRYKMETISIRLKGYKERPDVFVCKANIPEF